MSKILVISAHPDDEVLGMGGTIAKYSSLGDEIALLIVTDGSTSQYKDRSDLNQIINNKKSETSACAKILGINHLFYGNLPDMKLDSVPHVEINSIIEKVVTTYQPTSVYTHFYGDINMDHRMVYESTLVACRPFPGQCVKKIFLYSVPSSTEWNSFNTSNSFVPNWYENITGEFAIKKYKALECYTTELRDYPHPRSIPYVKKMDNIEGNRVGLLEAESFMLIRAIEN